MTDNDLRQPPALIEPDSDDEEGPRKRQRIDEGTPDHRIAILQAALMLVVAAELHTDQNLNSYHEVLSHRGISNRRDGPACHHVTSSVSNLTAPRLDRDSTLSKPTASSTESHNSKLPRHHAELSRLDTNSHILNAIATGATTNAVTRNVSILPSGRPLLAPPRLPHLKRGERFTTPTSRLQTLRK